MGFYIRHYSIAFLQRFSERAYKAASDNDLICGIEEILDLSVVIPPGVWNKEHFYFEQMNLQSPVPKKTSRKSVTFERPAELIGKTDAKVRPCCPCSMRIEFQIRRRQISCDLNLGYSPAWWQSCQRRCSGVNAPAALSALCHWGFDSCASLELQRWREFILETK